MNKQLNPRQIKTIQNFWNWFQDNEQTIYHALKLEINKDEVLLNIKRNLNYVSKRIECIITEHPQKVNKLKLFLTAYGYRKLFPKMIALEEKIPILEHFSIQVYITPLIQENPTIPANLIETIKKTCIKLEDYNIASKKIILALYFDENIMQQKEKKSIDMPICYYYSPLANSSIKNMCLISSSNQNMKIQTACFPSLNSQNSLNTSQKSTTVGN